jgi:hypothetical protein
MLEALNRHRGKGQQKVTVGNVHVHTGGQAGVGLVDARLYELQGETDASPVRVSDDCCERLRTADPCQGHADALTKPEKCEGELCDLCASNVTKCGSELANPQISCCRSELAFKANAIAGLVQLTH